MMKKLLVLLSLFLLLPAGTAHSTVAVKEGGVYVGEATAINVDRSLNTTFDGSTVTFLANGHKEGVTTNVSTESNLTSAELAFGVIRFVAGTTKTITTAAGVKGQMVTLMTSDAGVQVTIGPNSYPASPVAHTGWTSIVISATGSAYLGKEKSITLLWLDDTYGWIVVGNNGCTVAKNP